MKSMKWHSMDWLSLIERLAKQPRCAVSSSTTPMKWRNERGALHFMELLKELSSLFFSLLQQWAACLPFLLSKRESNSTPIHLFFEFNKERKDELVSWRNWINERLPFFSFVVGYELPLLLQRRNSTPINSIDFRCIHLALIPFVEERRRMELID